MCKKTLQKQLLYVSAFLLLPWVLDWGSNFSFWQLPALLSMPWRKKKKIEYQSHTVDVCPCHRNKDAEWECVISRCACKWGNRTHLSVERWSADFKLLWKGAASHEERCVTAHPRNLWAALYDCLGGLSIDVRWNNMQLQGSVQHVMCKCLWKREGLLVKYILCFCFLLRVLPSVVNELQRSKFF